MNNDLKKEFASTYLKESVINDVYRKLKIFEELEVDVNKDIGELEINDLLIWYIENSSKFSYNSIKPIKSYIVKYKEWLIENNKIPSDRVPNKYERYEVTKAVINKYKKILIRNLDELEDMLVKAYPIEDQKELDTNINLHIIYSLTFLGLTFEEIINLVIQDIENNYVKVEININNNKICIDNLLLINLLTKCQNVREIKHDTNRKNNKVSTKIYQIHNDYLINFDNIQNRSPKYMKKIFYARAGNNYDKEIYLANVEKFGIIKRIKDYEKENNLKEITNVEDIKEFNKLFQMVYPFKNQAEKRRFLVSKARDFFCIYLAW